MPIIKSNKTLIILLLLFDLLIPVKSNAQWPFRCTGPSWFCEKILNPYFVPNDTSLAWYGSGDVDGNDIRDMDDYDAMVSGIQNDMADVDGDGNPSTEEDIQYMSDYLDGSISYLPGHWNQLLTRDERDSWIEKMMKIDKSDTAIWTFPDWISGAFSDQLHFNFFGNYNPEDPNVNEKWDFSMNGRFNLPVFNAWTIDTASHLGHGMNAILTGDDPLNFNDWNFIEPQNDSMNVRPGTWNMPFTYFVGIYGVTNFYLNGSNEHLPLVAFITDSVGNPRLYLIVREGDTLIAYHEDLTLERPPIPEERIKPVVAITYPEQDSTYKSHKRRLEYTLTEQNPDSCWYSTEDAIRISTPCGETITGLQSVVGENIWKVYAKDEAGNMGRDSVTFSVDTTTIGVENDLKTIPTNYVLKQNYPNPFNPETVIEYALPQFGEVSLVVYNLIGVEVIRLIDGNMPAGNHQVIWDASNLASGIYLYRFQSGDFVLTRKMILLK